MPRLELGSGRRPTPGWLHLDVNPDAPDVHYVGSAYPLPPNVITVAPFTALRAVDVLEHLSYRVVHDALDQWASVLERDGELYVQVPDAEAIMREAIARLDSGRTWSVDRQRGVHPMRAAEWRLLGGHADGVFVRDGEDFRWNAHYSLWSTETLTGALDDAGFDVRKIESNDHPNLCCWAVKR